MRRACAVLFACIVAGVATASAFGAPFPWVRGNPADRLADRPIERYRYDRGTRCWRAPARGARALESWMRRNFRGESWGIVRCERLGRGYSLHAEGRALDWRLSARSPADRRAAARLIGLLLAPDRRGNEHALARRMGVQEIIWDCRSWFSGSQTMRPYRLCYDAQGRRRRVSDTLAHRDHVHIGLNLPGARAQTSFWRR